MRTVGFIALAIALSFGGVAFAQPHQGDDRLRESLEDEAAELLPEEHAEAHAEEGHEEGHGHGELSISALVTNSEFQGAVFNVIVLFLIFGWAIKKKVTPALIERKREVQEQLEEAKRMREEAEAKHREYTSRLEKLDAEIGEIRADMIKAGEAERDRIVADAEAKASRLRRETEFLIEQRMKELEQTLTREAVEAAVGAAQKVLAESTTADDQTRLADTYLEAVGRAQKEGAL